MKKYEFMYIVKPDLDEEATKDVVTYFNDVLAKADANVLEFKEWGLRDLAYEIDHHKKGYYVWLLFEGDSEAVNELNRLARINENIIRYIVVKEGEWYYDEPSSFSRKNY